ncbi:MAG: 3D domain-containing protein [Oscillospiraceae bacterium]
MKSNIKFKLNIVIVVVFVFVYLFGGTKESVKREDKEGYTEKVQTVDLSTSIPSNVINSFISYDVDVPKVNVIGNFRITVYTPQSDNGKWGYQTATGVTSRHLSTIAVDKDVVPLGSIIYINGLELTAVDTGSAVKGNVIDIFYDGSDNDAKAWIRTFGTSHNAYVLS